MDELNQSESSDAGSGNDLGETLREVREGLEQTKTIFQGLDRLTEQIVSVEKMLNGRHLVLMDREAKMEVQRMVKAVEGALERVKDVDPSVPCKHADSSEIAEFIEKLADHFTAFIPDHEALSALISEIEETQNSLLTLEDLTRARVAGDREIRANLQDFQKHLGEGKDEKALLQEATNLIALTVEHVRVNMGKTEQIQQTIASSLAWISKASGFLENGGSTYDVGKSRALPELISLLKDLQVGTYGLIELFNIRSMRDDALGLSEQEYDSNLF